MSIHITAEYVQQGIPPLATQPVTLHPAKVTAWCGLAVSFIIGPCFFEETGAFDFITVTVTGQRYEGLLHNPVSLDLQQCGCVDGIPFMQDGALPHIANPVKQLLKGHFGNARVISHHFLTVSPPRSPDLNPCDFWLWGYLKELRFTVIQLGGNLSYVIQLGGLASLTTYNMSELSLITHCQG
ncbi:uncharacterized protein TNCV_1401151 [Trichonephila clavipes]|nr:uncharacterized protein TNCV_1401151 [Trichonephila clavipes]